MNSVVDPVVIDGAVYGFLAWVVYLIGVLWRIRRANNQIRLRDGRVTADWGQLAPIAIVCILVGASVGWLWP